MHNTLSSLCHFGNRIESNHPAVHHTSYCSICAPFRSSTRRSELAPALVDLSLLPSRERSGPGLARKPRVCLDSTPVRLPARPPAPVRLSAWLLLLPSASRRAPPPLCTNTSCLPWLSLRRLTSPRSSSHPLAILWPLSAAEARFPTCCHSCTGRCCLRALRTPGASSFPRPEHDAKGDSHLLYTFSFHFNPP